MEKAWRNGQADLMKFSKEKCKVLLLERNNCALQSGCQPTGKQLCREKPGNPGGAADPSQQHALVTKAATSPQGGTLPLAQHWGGSAAGLGHCWAPLCRDTHWNKSSELR